MPTISIIVPVYNAERHLAETLDSLLEQTYRNIEIICVDDGSTDKSGIILKQYAADSRISILSQENAGVSVARNNGITAASGDIIMFADADDMLVPEACAEVASVFADVDVEMFTFGFRCEPPEAMPLGMEKELQPPEKTYEQFEASLLFEDKARPYPWRTAFSRAFVLREGIHFEPNIALGEDQVLYFASYPFSRKTVLKSDQLYIYRMDATSATHTRASATNATLMRIEQHMRVIEAIMRIWDERNMNSLCADELLEWMLDFTLFDINSLPAAQRHKYAKRLIGNFDNYFENRPESHARHVSSRLCLAAVRKIPQNNLEAPSRIPFFYLGCFYLRRYGFIRCIQQVLIGMGILKKWK